MKEQEQRERDLKKIRKEQGKDTAEVWEEVSEGTDESYSDSSPIDAGSVNTSEDSIVNFISCYMKWGS